MIKLKKFNFDTIKRLWGYIKKNNKARILLVAICIVINTIAIVAGSLYLQVLIDDYIGPLARMENPDYGTLIKPILTMTGIYLVRNYNNFYLYKSYGKNISRYVKMYT